MRNKSKIGILIIMIFAFFINGMTYAKTNSNTKDIAHIIKGKQTIYPIRKSFEMSDLIAMVEITNTASDVKAPWLSTVFSCKILKIYKDDASLINKDSIKVIQRGTNKYAFNGYPVFKKKQHVLLFLKKATGHDNTYRILCDEVNTFLLSKVDDKEYLAKLIGADRLFSNISVYYGDILDKVAKNITFLANNENQYIKKTTKLQVFEAATFEKRLQRMIDEKNSGFITKDGFIKVDNDLVKANNGFGLNILKQEFVKNKDNQKNILVSPFSMFTALSVATNGADGDTREQMKSVLGVASFSNDKLNDKINDVINIFNYQKYTEGHGLTNIYNSLWINNSFNIKDSFTKIAKDYYDSDVIKEDFKSPNAVKAMNNWIDQKSGGLIKNPIEELDPMTKLSIFNVLHFVDKWDTPFDKSMTKKEDFTTSSNKVVSVDMMNAQNNMSYYEDEDTKVGVFPYNNTNMMVLLPKGDINEFAAKLNYDMLNKYNTNLRHFKTKVKMPKLAFEYKDVMNDSLKNMGMILPFDPDKANFNNIKTDTIPLYIGRAFHDCVIKLDEEGTEASALTVLEVKYGAAPLPEEIKELYLNKPYIFIIQGQNNLALFVGKVENPLSK